MGFFDLFKRKAAQAPAAVPKLPSSAQATAGDAAQAASAAAAQAQTAAAVADDDIQAALAEEISQESGGLAGLLDKFGAGGLGDVVQSWVGKGENKSISADQIKSVLGMEKLQAMAGKLGVSPDMAADKLAAVMPTVIDKLTPDGLVPDPDALADKLTGFIKKTF